MKKLIISGVIVALIGVMGISVFAKDTVKVEEKTEKPVFAITEEQQEILVEKIKTDLEEMLEAEDITSEQYEQLLSALEKRELYSHNERGNKAMHGKSPKAELTDEEKAAMTEKMKESLDSKLSSGLITQEEYDEAIAALEKGDFKHFDKKKADRKAMSQPGENKTELPNNPGRNMFPGANGVKQRQGNAFAGKSFTPGNGQGRR